MYFLECIDIHVNANPNVWPQSGDSLSVSEPLLSLVSTLHPECLVRAITGVVQIHL